MKECKCEKGEHHQGMDREARITHLESCMAETIHKLECIKDELKALRTQ